MSLRRVALEVLDSIIRGGKYSNLALKDALSEKPSSEAAWVSALVYETLDRLMYIDYIIDYCSKGKLNHVIKGILRLGVCQALFMSVPDRAACDESVKLTKEIGKGALAGYVNGVMRTVCRLDLKTVPMPKDDRERLAVKYSYPRWIVDEYVRLYGLEFAGDMLEKPSTPFTVRAHPPYTSEMLETELNGRGMGYIRGRLVKDAYKLTSGFNPVSDSLYNDGFISIQSESAMLVCQICGAMQGMKVLDACAAPGGKTAYLSALMADTGSILAWEVHQHRKELLDRTLERLHVMNAVTALHDARLYNEELDEKMDVVLVDAPCSGLGVRGKPDARYRKTDEVIAGLSEIQFEILSTCSKYVKKGGALVYATCTISERENEGIMKRFLEKYNGFHPADIKPYVPMELWPRVKDGALQLFPHLDGTEGFFIAKMQRKAD